MNAISVAQAAQNLPGLIADVINDAEPVIICSDSGQQVVCLPLDEFNAWKETIYLLASPANADHLRRSIREASAGQVEVHALQDP